MTTMTGTAVLFRVWTGDCAIDGDTHGNVIAMFPYEPFNSDARLCMSFEHAGQHGSAEPDGVIANSRPATADEAAPLLAELEGRPYGYQLHVMSRPPHTRYAAPMRARKIRSRQAAAGRQA